MRGNPTINIENITIVLKNSSWRLSPTSEISKSNLILLARTTEVAKSGLISQLYDLPFKHMPWGNLTVDELISLELGSLVFIWTA